MPERGEHNPEKEVQQAALDRFNPQTWPEERKRALLAKIEKQKGIATASELLQRDIILGKKPPEALEEAFAQWPDQVFDPPEPSSEAQEPVSVPPAPEVSAVETPPTPPPPPEPEVAVSVPQPPAPPAPPDEPPPAPASRWSLNLGDLVSGLRRPTAREQEKHDKSKNGNGKGTAAEPETVQASSGGMPEFDTRSVRAQTSAGGIPEFETSRSEPAVGVLEPEPVPEPKKVPPKPPEVPRRSQSRNVDSRKEEEELKKQFQSLQSRAWRLGIPEAEVRKFSGIAEAQNRIMEQETFWRRQGPEIPGLTKDVIERIIHDDYPVEKIIELRSKIKQGKSAPERDLVYKNPEGTQTYYRPHIVEIARNNGMTDAEINAIQDTAELARVAGEKIEKKYRSADDAEPASTASNTAQQSPSSLLAKVQEARRRGITEADIAGSREADLDRLLSNEPDQIRIALKSWEVPDDKINEILTSSDPRQKAIDYVTDLRKRAETKPKPGSPPRAVEVPSVGADRKAAAAQESMKYIQDVARKYNVPVDGMSVEEAIRKVTAEMERQKREAASQKPISGVHPEEQTIERKGAMVTMARVKKYDDLHANTEKEGDEKFKEVTREVWKEFVVHGIASRDKEGKLVIKRKADLDGRTVAGLLNRAGIDIQNVEYVAPGQSVKGRINIDTGNKDGFVVEDEGKTAYLDHHTTESGRENSAAKVAYEILTKLGLLERQPHLDKLVEFVTKCDNLAYPREEYGKKSTRTLVGLRKNLTFRQMERFFSDGKDPLVPLSEEELKKIVVYEKRDRQDKVVKRQTLFDRSENRRKSIEQAENRLKEMERDGLIIDSKEYGKIIVDINGTLGTGADAAKASGAGAYLIWSPEQQRFFLSTFNKPIKEELGQGFPIRDTMWMKPITDLEPLSVNLKDILVKLSGGEFTPTGALKEFIETGKPPYAKEKVVEEEQKLEEEEWVRVTERPASGIEQKTEIGEKLEDLDRATLLRLAQKQYLDLELADRLPELNSLGKSDLKFLLLEYNDDAEIRQRISEIKDITDEDIKRLAHELSRGPKEAAETVSRVEYREKRELGGEIKLVAADLSEYVDRYARMQARERWKKEMENSGFLQRFRLHAQENYFIEEYYKEIRETIEKNHNLMTLLETRVTGKKSKTEVQAGNEKESSRVLDAIVEAYLNDLGITDKERGEKVVNDKALNEGLGELFYQYAKQGNWDREKFDWHFAKLLGSLDKKKFSKDSEIRGKVFASNVYEYAESYKGQIERLIAEYGPENEQALRAHINGLMNVDLQLGRKESDIAKDPKKLGLLDRFQARAQANPVLKYIANPFVMGAFTSVVGQVAARKGLTFGLTTATAAFMAPATAAVVIPIFAGAAVGSVYSAIRRNKEVKEDWTSERVLAAAGLQAGGERAEQVRESMVKMVDAGQRARELRAENVSKDLVADTIARLYLEGKQDVQELFSASAENSQLASRQADLNQLHLALRELNNRPGYSREELKDLIARKTEAIEKELKDKEEVFNKFKRSQNWRAARQGAMSAIAGGIISQELIAVGKDVLGMDSGGTMVRNSAKSVNNLIKGGWEGFSLGTDPLDIESRLQHIPDVEARVHTPQGFEIVDNGHRTADLMYKNEVIEKGLQYDDHGKLTEASKQLLESKGWSVESKSAFQNITVEDAKVMASSGELREPTLQDLKENFGDADWGTHKRIDWHDEPGKRLSWRTNDLLSGDLSNPRLIEYEGKQQMLYLEQNNGRVSVNAAKVLENLSQNLDYLRTPEAQGMFINPDNSVDTKMKDLVDKLHAWRESGELGKHLHAVVLPDKSSGISAVFEADTNGRATLSESLSKICDPASLKDGKLPFTIELRLDGHVLATATEGDKKMMVEDIIERIAKKIPGKLEISDTYLRPPLDVDGMEPGIATPIAKRYHLETAKVRPIFGTTRRADTAPARAAAASGVASHTQIAQTHLHPAYPVLF